MTSLRRVTLSALPLLALAVALPAAADTIDEIKQAGAVNFGYRPDAAPFAYVGADGTPKGYSVELCQRVARSIGRAAGVQNLTVNFVQVSAAERFTALATKKIDVLCEATTITFSRRETMDFSLVTFGTGASVLVRGELKNLGGFAELAGRKVGVLVGTTTAQALRGALTALDVKAEVQIFTSHDLGLAALEGGAIDAYFADRELLVGLLKKSTAPDKLAISEGQFTYEPYGLAMRKGEDRLRLAVDRALAQLFASGAAAALVQRNFGRPASPDLQMIYTIQSFPD